MNGDTFARAIIVRYEKVMKNCLFIIDIHV